MTIEKVVRNNVICAVVHSEDKVITDTSSALDLLIPNPHRPNLSNQFGVIDVVKESFYIHFNHIIQIRPIDISVNLVYCIFRRP